MWLKVVDGWPVMVTPCYNSCLGLELYMDHYQRDFPWLFLHLPSLTTPPGKIATPISSNVTPVFQHLRQKEWMQILLRVS